MILGNAFMSTLVDDFFSIKFVEELIQSFNGTAHLKDLKSGKYVLSNDANIKKVGLTNINDICGLTVHDLHSHMKNYWGEDMAKQISKLDNKLKTNPEIIIDQNRFYLNANQFVFIHNMKKYPILNAEKKISYVLTINEDITNQVSLLKLWQLYKVLFKNKNIAMSKYLQYTGVYDFFYELPTNTELIILLTRQFKVTSKDIAKVLYISQRTVETHINNLRNKTKIELNLLMESMAIRLQ